MKIITCFVKMLNKYYKRPKKIMDNIMPGKLKFEVFKNLSRDSKEKTQIVFTDFSGEII